MSLVRSRCLLDAKGECGMPQVERTTMLRIRPFAAPLARSNVLRVQLSHAYIDRALESNYKINREIARVI